MKKIRLSEKRAGNKKLVMTIGVFDGVHIGHQEIISYIVKRAKRKDCLSCVLTFSPHPSDIVHPCRKVHMLFSLAHRIEILKRFGVDIVYVVNFNRRLASMDYERFAGRILIKKLRLAEIVVGDNFNMGRDRKGNVLKLKHILRQNNIKVKIINCKKYKGRTVSSTLIRKALMSGNLRMADHLLGRPFSIMGKVVHGDNRGREIGFKTANLDIDHEVLPPAGVYAVKVHMGSKVMDGIVNVGFRPTFKSIHDEPTVEVHILGLNANIYGENIEVIFRKKIRPEWHFSNKTRLYDQIVKDIIKAKRVLS